MCQLMLVLPHLMCHDAEGFMQISGVATIGCVFHRVILIPIQENLIKTKSQNLLNVI